MHDLHRSRRRPPGVASVACRVALTLGLAASAVAGSAAAQAQAVKTFPTQPIAVSWGDNASGQLGDEDPGVNSAQYVDVTGLSGNVMQVAAGQDDSLAVMSDGTVWAWGGNGTGQLGDGTTGSRATAVKVTGLSGITQVAAGYGFSLALRSDGTVLAWGDNRTGQLGDGTTAERLTPVQVTGLTGVTQIAAGLGFSLALRSDGTVWAWGWNGFGQLGNAALSGGSTTAQQIPGLTRVTMIAASTEAAMAVRTTGLYTILTSVWTWGSNIWGQLGDGTTTSRATPQEVSGINAPSIVGIAANNAFSAALGSDGTVWEWGANNYGQLGDGTTTERLRPVEAIGLDSGITQISAGGSHVLALRSDGTVLAWGRNVEGQLGDGVTSTESLGQVQVTGLTGVTQVAAGYDHSLAVQRVFRVRLPLTAQHP